MTPRPEAAITYDADKTRGGQEGKLFLASQQEPTWTQRFANGSSISLGHDAALGLDTATLTNPMSESLTVAGRSGQGRRSPLIDSFKLSENGQVINGTLHDGSWVVQAPDNRWQNLKNVRLGQDRQSLAFESRDLKTDYWQLDGRKYTTDGKLPPTYFTGADGRTTSAPAVTEATAADGTKTEFHYEGNSYSELNSYTIRNKAGTIEEFGVRNVDGQDRSHWITFKPKAGGSGLLSNMSATAQAETLRSVEETAASVDDPSKPQQKRSLPQELVGRAISDPYQQVVSNAVDGKGHLYQTLYNGTSVTQEDGRTYRRTAGGLLTATEAAADGSNRLLLSQSRTDDHGLVTDRFTYDQSGKVVSVTEESAAKDASGKPLFSKQYQLQDGRWLTADGADANVQIKNYPDGRVAMESLSSSGQGGRESDSVRTFFPSGGKVDLAKLANGKLGIHRIVSATGDNTTFSYGPGSNLVGAEQLSPGVAGANVGTRTTYSPGPGGRWQRTIQGALGTTKEEVGRLTTIDDGGISFEKARLDQRGDFMYSQREISQGHRLLPDAKPPQAHTAANDRRLIQANIPNISAGESGLRMPSWMQALADSAPADSESAYALKSLTGTPTLYKSPTNLAYAPNSLREAKERNYYAKKDRGDRGMKTYWS